MVQGGSEVAGTEGPMLVGDRLPRRSRSFLRAINDTPYQSKGYFLDQISPSIVPPSGPLSPVNHQIYGNLMRYNSIHQSHLNHCP